MTGFFYVLLQQTNMASGEKIVTREADFAEVRRELRAKSIALSLEEEAGMSTCSLEPLWGLHSKPAERSDQTLPGFCAMF